MKDESKSLKNKEAENLKKEIKFCVDIQTKVNDLKKNIADKTYKIARGSVLDFLNDVRRYFESEGNVFKGKRKIELKRIIALLQCDLNTSFVLNFKINDMMEKVERFMKELTEIRKLKN